MARFWVVVAVAGLFAGGCATPPRMDLRENENLYRLTGYRAKAKATRSVHVAAVLDQRRPPQVSSDSVGYLDDDDWDRPPPEMIHGVLVDELRASGLFTAVVDQPQADTVLVQPTLNAFEGGLQEALYGRRSLARVDLLVEISGPETDGKRPSLLRQSFADQQLSNTDFRPPSPRVLLGTSLRRVMARLQAATDALAGDGKATEASGKK